MTMTPNTCLDCNAPTTNKLFCSGCLDADSTLQSRCPCGAAITGPGAYCSSRCVRAHGPRQEVVVADDETIAFLARVRDGSDEEDSDDEVSVTTPNPVFEDMPHVTHTHADMCCCCLSIAHGTCRCGRRVCGGCVDGETSLCPYCDEVVEDVAEVVDVVDRVDVGCYA